jgi:uncharacterized membrane protein YjfL (UPF0719 family)
MKDRFLKSKMLRGMAGGLLAAIIVLIVFLVVPIIAGQGLTAKISEGGGSVGGSFGIQQVGAYR